MTEISELTILKASISALADVLFEVEKRVNALEKEETNQKLKLYELGRTYKRYDETSSMLVMAENEDEARQIALESDHYLFEQDDWSEWLDPQRSTCKDLTYQKGVVVRNYDN